MSKEIIYVGDPMCSWCWGFSPVVKEILQRYGDLASFSLVLGGLRTGAQQVLDQSTKTYIQQHWQAVSEKTGQPFDFSFFAREGFVYNTEPACRAAIVVRSQAVSQVFDYFETLHRAFYAENRDITDAEILADLAHETGIERRFFLSEFHSADMAEKTRGDFLKARELGVGGFPSLLVRDSDGILFLSRGYQPFATLKSRLDECLGDMVDQSVTR